VCISKRRFVSGQLVALDDHRRSSVLPRDFVSIPVAIPVAVLELHSSFERSTCRFQVLAVCSDEFLYSEEPLLRQQDRHLMFEA
jgi:hypothetical protein